MRSAIYAVLTALLLAAAPVHAIILNGSLTTNDLLSSDEIGGPNSFYSDWYQMTVNADTAVTVSLFSADFAPYVAIWNTNDVPTAVWQDSGAGIDIYQTALAIDLEDFPNLTASFTINALAGVTYWLSLTSTYYLHQNEPVLGDYVLTLDGASDASPVPEPTALLLMATGMLAAGAGMRKRIHI
jgi:PEP-CTERM motif